MSVDRRPRSPVAEGEQPPASLAKASSVHQLPAEISRMTQLRHTVSQPFVASFLAGGVAGAVSRTLVSPLERLKILLQVQSLGRNEYKLSIPQGLMKMWREEGWRGFMRGNGSNCIRIVPYSAVQFSSYGFYKRLTFLYTAPGSFARGRLASVKGAILRSVRRYNSCLLHVPSGHSEDEVIDTIGIVRLFDHATTKEPPRDVGNSEVGLNFMTYEFIRQYLTPEGDKKPSPWRKLVAGAVSGAFAQTCTYPFDVLRRRFQINTMSGMGFKYTSMWHAVTVIIKQEGIRGMYKGILPNLLKVAPSMASNWLSFEMTRDMLTSLGDDDSDDYS
ncbi:MAG: hypothetical protein Q9163_000387 [Psora crenata]